MLAALVLVACGGDGGDGEGDGPDPAAGPEGAPAERVERRPLPEGDIAVRVGRTTPLRARPRPGARVLVRATRRTTFGGRRLMAVVRRKRGWLGVLHEDLPAGRIAWLPVEAGVVLREPWSIDVDLSERSARLRRRGKVVQRFAVAVGAPATSTPAGRFAVTDRLRPESPGGPYGCCVLALTGRQPNLPQGWGGGDRLALHGTSAPASIGSASSSGCVRVGERDLRRLFRRVPVGARVTIRP